MKNLNEIQVEDKLIRLSDRGLLMWKDGTSAKIYVKRIIEFNTLGFGTDIHIAYEDGEINRQIPTEPSDVLPFTIPLLKEMLKNNYLVFTKI